MVFCEESLLAVCSVVWRHVFLSLSEAHFIPPVPSAALYLFALFSATNRIKDEVVHKKNRVHYLHSCYSVRLGMEKNYAA